MKFIDNSSLITQYKLITTKLKRILLEDIFNRDMFTVILNDIYDLKRKACLVYLNDKSLNYHEFHKRNLFHEFLNVRLQINSKLRSNPGIQIIVRIGSAKSI